MQLRQINKNIGQIARNSAALNALIQTTAVGILVHCFGEGEVQGSGDCTAALRLVNALPKSHRRGLLIDWFARYSPIGMNVNNNKVGLHKPESKMYNAPNIAGARANNWFEGAAADDEKLPDTSVEAYQKKLFSLANSIQKRLDAGEVPAEDRDNVIDLQAAVKALAKKAYAAAKAAEPAAPVVAAEAVVAA